MNTANGTVCWNGIQVWESVCGIQIDDSTMTAYPSPGPSPSQNPTTNPNPNPSDCICDHIGVNCIENCSPYYCLCGQSMTGLVRQTALNTVCYDSYQTWADDGRCSYQEECVDGFYCTTECSITYYYCVNGKRTSTDVVPYGTVCRNGTLDLPEKCVGNYPVQTCEFQERRFQCLSECSRDFYYCQNNTVYAYQIAPDGLLCAEDSLVLASNPSCSSGDSVQIPLNIQISNRSWSVLSQYALCNAIADSVTLSGIPLNASSVYVSESGSEARRLEEGVVVTIYSQHSKEQLIHGMNTYLNTALQFRNIQWQVAPAYIPAPSPSRPDSSPRSDSPILIGSIVAAFVVTGALAGILYSFFHRKSHPKVHFKEEVI